MALDRRDAALGRPSPRPAVATDDAANLSVQERVSPPEGALLATTLPARIRGPLIDRTPYQTTLIDRIPDWGAGDHRITSFYPFVSNGEDILGTRPLTLAGTPGTPVTSLIVGDPPENTAYSTSGGAATLTAGGVPLTGVGSAGVWFKTDALGTTQTIIDTGAAAAVINPNGTVTYGTNTSTWRIEPGRIYFGWITWGFGSGFTINGTVTVDGGGANFNATLLRFGSGAALANPLIGTIDEAVVADWIYGVVVLSKVFAAGYLGTTDGFQRAHNDPSATAVETSTALAGTVSKSVAGTIPQQDSLALAGTASKSIAGTLATEADTAVVGAVVHPQLITGVVAIESNLSLAGAAVKSTVGSLGAEADTALAGTVSKSIAGALASASNLGLAGSVSKFVAGNLGAEADTALAGVPRKAVTGTLAAELSTPLSGARVQIIAGTLAIESDTMLLAQARKDVSGSLASEADLALAGTRLVAAFLIFASHAREREAAVQHERAREGTLLHERERPIVLSERLE